MLSLKQHSGRPLFARLLAHPVFWPSVGLALGMACAGLVYAVAELIAHTWPELHP